MEFDNLFHKVYHLFLKQEQVLRMNHYRDYKMHQVHQKLCIKPELQLLPQEVVLQERLHNKNNKRSCAIK